VEDVGPCLAAADIGVLSSHEEGFSNAVLEGMAAGLPMLVTDVGGNAEAVLDGEHGHVVPARDPSALAARLVALALDPAQRRRFGAAAKARAQDCFSVDACVSQYLQMYRKLLAGTAPFGPD
jgi:glycosyltransferase involved in cell wall biosynthesis